MYFNSNADQAGHIRRSMCDKYILEGIRPDQLCALTTSLCLHVTLCVQFIVQNLTIMLLTEGYIYLVSHVR